MHPPPSDPTPRAWWEHPALVAVALLLCALPLAWPNLPPLTDLPGHLGRYHVREAIEHSPVLQSFYRYEWRLIGNLGVDLLVIPLSALLGLEPATRLVAMAIPVLTAAGFLWTAREVHGRLPPTAWFAPPLAYNYAFLFGFVNFALSMALALLGFAWWLRLGRQRRLRLRAAAFVPLSLLIWLAHVYGWALLGLLAFAAEAAKQWESSGKAGAASGPAGAESDRGTRVFAAGWHAGLACLPLALPMLLILLWRSGDPGGETAPWFDLRQKWLWLEMVLRDRWEAWDLGSLIVLDLILLLGLVWRRRLQYAPTLFLAAILLGGMFVALPRVIFGSNYADMRLLPYAIAVGILGIRLRTPVDGRGGRAGTVLAAAGLAFFAARTAATTASFHLYDRDYDRELAALDHVPRGARLVSFVTMPCVKAWARDRREHLPAMALVRRDAFANDQWSMAGAQPLTVIYPAGAFATDPSQIVFDRPCPGERSLTLAQALAGFPRDRFDYVWLIRPARFDPALTTGLAPVWRDGPSALYRVVDRRPTPAALP